MERYFGGSLLRRRVQVDARQKTAREQKNTEHNTRASIFLAKCVQTDANYTRSERPPAAPFTTASSREMWRSSPVRALQRVLAPKPRGDDHKEQYNSQYRVQAVSSFYMIYRIYDII